MNKSGQRFGEYRLVNEVGRGGKAIIYRAFQPQLSRYVALKVLTRRDQTSLLKFQQEGTITANFNHPGIRKVFTAGSTPDGTHYIVMEYVDLSLRQILQKAGGRPMRMSDVVPVVTRLAEVLDYIHGRGWVHLDIKPSNILRFNEGRVVLSDFGIARRIGQVEQHGTPQYMSPEQVLGRPVGPFSDVYSLGVVLYEMLAGRPPFQGENELAVMNQHRSEPPLSPKKFNRRLPPAVEKVILKALAKAPRERYQTAGEMAADLQKAAREGKGLSKTITTAINGVTGLSRQFKAGLALTMLLLVIAVVAFIARPQSPAPPTSTSTSTVTATEEVKVTPSITASMVQPVVTNTSTATPPSPTVTLGSTRTPTRTPTPGTVTPPVVDPCPGSRAKITSPAMDATVRGVVEIRGMASIPNFWKWKLEWVGEGTRGWHSIGEEHFQPVVSGLLDTWNTAALPGPGGYRLKLTIADITSNYPPENVCEVRVFVEQ